MINIIIIILVLILFFFMKIKKEPFFNIKYKQFINDDSLDLNYIKEITKNISIYRPVQSENLNKVKKYVINELRKINGLNIEEQFFKRNINGKDYNFSNIIAKNNNKDSNKDFILLSAHIDAPLIENIEASIDSATSIGIIIEITSKILKMYPNFPLLLVFYDGEEAVDGKWTQQNTLSGSKYFVDNLKFKIERAFILDLIGGNLSNKIKYFNNNPSSFEINKELHIINKKYDSEIFICPTIETSTKYIEDDQLPFALSNIPYIHLIPEIFPSNHHTINDNYNNLNWNYVNIFGNVLFEYLINSYK